MKNSKFEEYKKLKSLLGKKGYKGYPLSLVLGSYFAMLTWKPSVKLYFEYIFFSMRNFSMPFSNKIIFTYSTNRDDYIDLMKEYFPNHDPILVRVKNNIPDFILGLMISIKYFLKSLIYINGIKCSFKQKFILTIVVSIAFKVIDEIEKHDIETDIYIAFNSSYLIESFLSWYFRKKSVKTYSLQHGMYYKYASEIPFDVINYENVCAEKLLVWGDYTKNQVSHYLPKTSSCIVYGYPESKFPSFSPQTLSRKVLILLPRDIYMDDILSLLRYLADYDLEFLVRPHPSVRDEVKNIISSKDNFEFDDNMLLSETLKTRKFVAVVGFNSTTIFEASLYSQKILLFVTGNDEFSNPGFNEFNIESNFKDELEKKVFYQDDKFFSKVRMDLLSP